MPQSHRNLLLEKDNWSTDTDPGFENAEQNDFRLKKDSAIFTHIPGFEPIPFDRIGLYSDACRSTEK